MVRIWVCFGLGRQGDPRTSLRVATGVGGDMFAALLEARVRRGGVEGRSMLGETVAVVRMIG